MMIPLAGLFMLLSLVFMTIGEMVLSPRMIDYIGSISPKQKGQFFMGYANLPIACGIVIGSPLGGFLFQHFVWLPLQRGEAAQPLFIWLILALTGFISITGLLMSHRSWKKNQCIENPY
jgi:MFS family permease